MGAKRHVSRVQQGVEGRKYAGACDREGCRTEIGEAIIGAREPVTSERSFNAAADRPAEPGGRAVGERRRREDACAKRALATRAEVEVLPGRATGCVNECCRRDQETEAGARAGVRFGSFGNAVGRRERRKAALVGERPPGEVGGLIGEAPTSPSMPSTHRGAT